MKLGIIGCGNMGEILLSSLIEGSMFKFEDIFVSEKDISRQNYIKDKYSAVKILDNIELVKKTDIFILAVKPQNLAEVLKEISSYVNVDKLIVSIAAGVKLSFIQKFFEINARIIRVMPNAACFVKKGISALAKGKYATENDINLVKAILLNTGEVLEINEALMDVVTAVSGSGPGYISYIIDNLIEEAIAQGLNESEARKLVFSTLSGTVQLLSQTGMNPKDLINKVASKGGTTEAALNVFNRAKLNKIIRKAVKKATLRSKKLSK